MPEINAGLGPLSQLKQFILAESLVPQTSFDATLTAIGLGVAGMFSRHCNRDWDYGADNKDEATANRSFLVARRFPLDLSVPLVVERCDSLVDGLPSWVVVPGAAYNVGPEAGMIYLAGYQGSYLSRLRLSSAGGYWWPGLSDAKPDGAVQVPDQLRLAWLLQCQALWLVRDDLGKAIAGSSGGTALLGLSLVGYDLVPEVKALLASFIRYGMNG